MRYWSVSDRLAVLQIKLGTQSTLTIINAYGPTTQLVNNNQDLQEDFFSQLAALTTRYSSSSLFIIAGDFNSKLGRKQADELSLGEHSRGTRNRNGTALADFLEVNRLFVCNTAFQHAARHKTTWQGQYRDTTTGDIVPIYNVIDFVICRQAHKSILTDSRSYVGTLLDSDHRLLITKLDLRHLHIWEHLGRPQPKKRVRFNTDELTNAPKRAQFREGFIESLADIDTSSPVSERWSQIKQALSSAAESTIGRSVPGRNPPQCQEMAALSEAQRQLRLRIQNTRDHNRRQNLKQQRNRILHALRRKARDNASQIGPPGIRC